MTTKEDNTRDEKDDNSPAPEIMQDSPYSPAETQLPMDVHHHPDLHHAPKKWKEYFLEFLMIFLAVTMGFIAEQIREHRVEKERLHNYFGSMLLDIRSNITVLDSAVRENSKMVHQYDSIVKSVLFSADTVNRTAFAQGLGPIWYRGFTNRNETFEQMKSSGSLRYIDDFTLLTSIMQYVRATNFAQYRTENFERKYYTDYFLPAIYRNYDLTCKFSLDSAYTNDPGFMKTIKNHIDVLKGKDAENFKEEVGGALLLRLERLRVSISAYSLAKASCIQLKRLLESYLK